VWRKKGALLWLRIRVRIRAISPEQSPKATNYLLT
jgi:hypothetical protein